MTKTSPFRLLGLVFLIVGCFRSFYVNACNLEGENKKNAKIFYFKNDRLIRYNTAAYELKNCQTDILISKTIELPSPQNFSTESWMSQNATVKRSCEMVSNDKTRVNAFKDTTNQTLGLIELGNECLGLSVQETQQKPISISSSLNCQLVSKNSESSLLLKGENCRISGTGLINLKLEWVILNSCKAKASAWNDINLRLRTATVSRQKDSTAAPELILDKKLELVFENGTDADPRFKLGDQSYSVRKSSNYEFDFDFLNLSLVGSKYSQVRAKSEFLVKNYSTQKIPFVLNHSLFLVKNGNYSSPIQLSTWYSGAYIPGPWMGMDGLSETFNFGPSFDSFVLNENVTKIQAGDALVLQTQLLSPNRGPQKFVDFFKEQLKKYQKANPTAVPHLPGENKISEIKPISGMGGVHALQEIGEIDQAWADPKVSAFTMIPLSPVYYRSYCLNGECRGFEDMDVLPEVRVSFEVEESEIGIKVKPINVWKRNFKGQVTQTELTDMSQIKCF